MYYHPSNIAEPLDTYDIRNQAEVGDTIDWNTYTLDGSQVPFENTFWPQASMFPHDNMGFQRRRSSSVGAAPFQHAEFLSQYQQKIECITEEEYLPVPHVTDPSLSGSPFSSASSDTHMTSPPQQHQTLFPEIVQPNTDTPINRRPAVGKRRRSSSVPSCFQRRPPARMEPLVFAQMQVTDPRPPAPPVLHHQPPVPIERVQRMPPKPSTTDPEEEQRKKDHELLNTDFDDITVAALKELLRQRKLPSNGKKADLIDRLRQERTRVLISKLMSPSPLVPKQANSDNHCTYNSSYHTPWNQEMLNTFLEKL
ncbi:hypothetical protein J3Q64DRAFT_1747032 [Phycomyces blakesleeanus]|uniref:SAP domain-containing protein n=2 Tax=Phycomyces blakesleeanus TaxID=4837 RepID=A0A162U505_PHYB8|nr:hypothetical protein PHYBLDRAFT_187370 [Phycomyces blakesleeanus NRRL 1555(-)]OAD72373.1 hypothetical protein PHYBLDRAFT_187370 [Phycomyces blakesleeanus NRRL 1555(-)]|eukprot:XP_018290413.1 hypothetical protein PHYBLDRAFT_187370 [Phycomyces blakesleeanus NRRL 1555(-)]